MLTSKWNLSDVQCASNPPLSEIQAALAARDILLDFSYENGTISFTLSVLDPADYCPGSETDKASNPLPTEAGNETSVSKRRGRPNCVPANDLTLEQVKHMRSTRVPAITIAKELGVSRKTFYRRWNAAKANHIKQDTPFSMWDPLP